MTDSAARAPVPADMIDWSRTAATLLRALGRAHPGGAPDDVEAVAERMVKAAARAATLAGVIETLSKALEQLRSSGEGFRAHVEGKMGALSRDGSEGAQKELEALRADLARFHEALEQDARAGRQRLDAHVEEARACEATFVEASAALLERLRTKPACRELLEGLSRGPG